MVSAQALMGASAANAASYVIEMKDLRFGPAPKELKIGDEIVWKNSDILRHTATARNGDFDVTIEPDTSKASTLSKAGEVSVFCRFHPDMMLQLTVTK